MIRTVIFALVLLGATTLAGTVVNDRPIIGVFSQPLGTTKSYTAASYVKFIEAAGARAAPISWDLPADELETLLSSVNGLLLPGGGNYPTDSSGALTPFYLAEQLAIRYAMKMNDNGIYFPIWAVCQSFEFLACVVANDTSILSSGLADNNINHKLIFTEATRDSALFSGLSDYLFEHIQNNEDVNYDHVHGIKPSTFNNSKYLVGNLTLLATSKNSAGVEFVGSYEHQKYPFYATQFHPEKAPFEWHTSVNATHTVEAIEVAQYFGNFFNGEARKNNNSFASSDAEYDALIYNYNSTETNGTFMQNYYFPLQSSSSRSLKQKSGKVAKAVKRLLRAFF